MDTKKLYPILKTGVQRWLFSLAVLGVLSILAGILFSEWYNAIPADAVATFVGRQSCIECHCEQADRFHNSHHDRAMDVATDETVLGHFDGSQIEHFGITSTVFRSGERFMVNTEGPDGKMADFEVKMVFGCEPMQQYMVEMKPPTGDVGLGQYQVLRLSWDVTQGKWFYLSPPDVPGKIDSDDPLHWTGISQRWNTNCAACHSTNLQRNFNPLTKSYATTYSEIDVSCEACHGPGSLHVKIANRRRFLWDRNHGYGLANLKSASNLTQVETCAPCHSRRSVIQDGFQAGDRFDDFYACQLLSDRTYQDDGQIRDEDYVYGSFIQSRMFHQGIRCTDCHDPHSARIKFDDNRLCTSCHQHPAGKYDSPSHHRHKDGSTGAKCIECHMPSTTYMAIDARRDHSLRIPRPDLSVDLGTPNACTACHIDIQQLPVEQREPLKQYLDWLVAAETKNEAVAAELDRVNRQMADAFRNWYPDAAVNPQRSKYYEDLVVGKSKSDKSRATLMQLATDRTAPAIFRASAIEEMTESPDELTAARACEALDDPDAKVVAAALSHLGGYFSRIVERAQYDSSPAATIDELRPSFRAVNPTLAHPSRAVRIEAVRTLALLPIDLRSRLLDASERHHYQVALSEYRDGLMANNDLAASHMILGNLSASDGQFHRAENEYRTAMSVEPNFVGPRTNIAASLDARAEELQNRLRRSPQDPTAASLVEQIASFATEAETLRRQENQLLAVEVKRSANLPGVDQLFYRFGLSCYIIGDQELAEKYLLMAHRLQPDEPSFLLALATFYDQKGQSEIAAPYVNRLIELYPRHQGYQRLRKEILSTMQSPRSND